jgi:hypothetical protein
MTTYSPNPIRVASLAQDMARRTDGVDGMVFNKVALVCMGTMAVASVLSVLHPLLRDLNRKHDRQSSRGGR